MPRYLQTAVFVVVCLCASLHAQDSGPSHAADGKSSRVDSSSNVQLPPIPTARDKWNNFAHETVSPLTFGAGTFNALFSQATNTDPKYGTDAAGFGQRFGASLADIATQNFFGDFAVASLFHEDPRYRRLGSGHGLLYRVGYAISRALVIRKDSGGNGFNFDNVLGSAMSAGFSNLYYPPASRSAQANFMHYSIDVADNGFVNLAPEFWPDFRRKLFGHHHHAPQPSGH